MLSHIVGRSFELFPVKLEENRVHCETCGGTKWMLEDEKWLVQCKDCYGGTRKVCPICGKVIYKTHYECFDCRPIKEARAEAARLEKAEKIEPDSERARSFGMMYSESIGDCENAYFEDWCTFFEKWHDLDYDGDRKRPEYVWGTCAKNLSLDAYDILESALDDFYEGASDMIGTRGYDALQRVLDEWVEQYGDVTSYGVDYRVAVRIPWEDFETERELRQWMEKPYCKLDPVEFAEKHLGLELFHLQKVMLRAISNDRDSSALYFRSFPVNVPVWVSYLYSKLIKDER